MSPQIRSKTQESIIEVLVKSLEEARPELAKEMEESRRVLGTIKPEEWQLRFTI
jgi:ribosomal protein S7